MIKQYGKDNVIVIVGFTSTFTLGETEDGDGRVGMVLVETFLNGDPAGAGALKRSDPPGIKTYSIFEFEDQVPKEVWKDKKLGMVDKKMELGRKAIKAFVDRLKELRGD